MNSLAGGYDSVLLKLSGNALADDGGAGFNDEQLSYISTEIKETLSSECKLGVVLGAGNILRGASFSTTAQSRLQADNAGMVATVVNGLVLQQALEDVGVAAYVCSAFNIGGIVPAFNRRECLSQLQSGNVVILTGGTGNPLFTTDTAAVLRAVQLRMDAVFKATRVNGVYSADPELDTNSRFYENLSYDQVLESGLNIMDFAAIDLCRTHNLPVRVFNFKGKGNLKNAVSGEKIGTLIGG